METQGYISRGLVSANETVKATFALITRRGMIHSGVIVTAFSQLQKVH